MKLQTQIPFEKQSKKLVDYNSNILLLGSCFSDNIGAKLDYFKFQNLQNPIGILFQPKAIETLVEHAVTQKLYSEKDIFFNNEQWHCFDVHSKLSDISKDNFLKNLNLQTQETLVQIQKSTHVVITLGTAWVYQFKETGKIVANCHKVPQNQFNKKLLSIEDIVVSLQNIINLIKKENEKVAFIFTVSPVRHIKDGFVENTLSKAHLVSAIHQVLKSNNQLHYFSSYEIMMDELRDYRFYAEDMIHPSQTAINYIWEKFTQVWIEGSALKAMSEVDAIQKATKHKPFNPNSEAHQKFLLKINEKKALLMGSYPHITF